MRTTTFNVFAMLLSCILILGLLGCPQQQLPAPTPGGGPTAQQQPPAEQPPVEQPRVETPAMPGGEFGQIILDFSLAMSEADFERAKTYCTQAFSDEIIKPMEEAWSQIPEDQKARMTQGYAVDEQKRESLATATTEVTGDTATLTFTEENGATTVFGFKKVEGDWKLDSVAAGEEN